MDSNACILLSTQATWDQGIFPARNDEVWQIFADHRTHYTTSTCFTPAIMTCAPRPMYLSRNGSIVLRVVSISYSLKQPHLPSSVQAAVTAHEIASHVGGYAQNIQHCVPIASGISPTFDSLVARYSTIWRAGGIGPLRRRTSNSNRHRKQQWLFKRA